MNINSMFLIDGYKADHRRQYPNGTTQVYSNFTPRKSRIEGVDSIVFFGLQYVIEKYLVDHFDKNFFYRRKEEVVSEYNDMMESYLGCEFDVEHIADLHDLGYLPIKIKALPEGTVVPMQTPTFTIVNTRPEFFWLTNYLETLLSCELWKLSTSATMAHQFRKNFERFAEETGGDKDFIEFQGHDFSFRGMSNVDDAASSGAAHLLSFKGTDTIPAIAWLRHYYQARGFIGCSVAGTEHSVMSAGSKGDRDSEFNLYHRLITEVYPNGIVSIVSDTYDFWGVVTDFLPRLKEEILNRNGKVVIRPDTGTPHKVICGDPEADEECIRKGLIECLWDTFGGTVNSKGYRTLDSHIGAIYGDSIDLREQVLILQGLKDKGFASDNIVLGIGSFTYQYVTRDTYGFVCKATNCEIDGEMVPIFKAPKTGAWKKSHKGLLRVNEDMSVTQECSIEEEEEGLLQTVFVDGHHKFDTYDNIRKRLNGNG